MKSTVTLIHPRGLLSWLLQGWWEAKICLGEGKLEPRSCLMVPGKTVGLKPFGPEKKEKQTSASKWGTWSEHLGTTRVLSQLGFCPLSRILTNTSASPLPTQLQGAGEQSVSFHLLHPRYVYLQQGIAHDKLTSCLWRDWSTPMLGEPSQPVGITHASRETRNPPVGNT